MHNVFKPRLSTCRSTAQATDIQANVIPILEKIKLMEKNFWKFRLIILQEKHLNAKSFCNGSYACVRVSSGMSDWLDMDTGVRQGSVLSS